MPKKGKQGGGPIDPPDFDKALKVYTADVVPANKAQKQAMKEASDAWKSIKDECRVHKGGFRTAMKVAEMEETDQQAWLRSFKAGCQKRNIRLYADAVDIMEGVNAEDLDVVPSGAAPKIDMPTVN